MSEKTVWVEACWRDAFGKPKPLPYNGQKRSAGEVFECTLSAARNMAGETGKKMKERKKNPMVKILDGPPVKPE